MKSSKFTSSEKARIVLESLNTNISIAELYRKHNLSPRTFYQWHEKFIDAGKSALNGTRNTCQQLQKENESLKQLIGEIAIANDILKKRWRAAKDDRSKGVKPE